ncbi:hypothetical protein DPMN_018102 [Dreissena polymorpha]|uniref:Uncharacterized protein n=1 Tax=Dreissena polymorpha TaxID=45954 RepID=A0A9D4NHS7_DREPO|nr:hypothetical protein DPMN_018102 [Dreissena polymorpha]
MQCGWSMDDFNIVIKNTFLVEDCILLLECSENAHLVFARGSRVVYTLGAIVAGIASRIG